MGPLICRYPVQCSNRLQPPPPPTHTHTFLRFVPLQIHPSLAPVSLWSVLSLLLNQWFFQFMNPVISQGPDSDNTRPPFPGQFISKSPALSRKRKYNNQKLPNDVCCVNRCILRSKSIVPSFIPQSAFVRPLPLFFSHLTTISFHILFVPILQNSSELPQSKFYFHSPWLTGLASGFNHSVD